MWTPLTSTYPLSLVISRPPEPDAVTHGDERRRENSSLVLPVVVGAAVGTEQHRQDVEEDEGGEDDQDGDSGAHAAPAQSATACRTGCELLRRAVAASVRLTS